MTPEEFIAWRAHLGINRAEAARRLFTHPNSITQWEKGRNAIPEMVALACHAVVKKLKPWPVQAAAPKKDKKA